MPHSLVEPEPIPFWHGGFRTSDFALLVEATGLPQTERRLMHRLVRKTAPSDASAVVSANMHFAFLDAVLFAGVSWCEGHDPMIQL
eukprot:scaffold278591_cov14-Tisochrysis_lutea.AAC.1